MQGRAFLDLAREIIRGATERHWRGTAGRAYYALVLECRDALASWGFSWPARETMHFFVRTRFLRSNHADLQAIGQALDRTNSLRNQADYNISSPGSFATSGAAQRAIRNAEDSLRLLDSIDNDPVRRRNAIAAIRAAFP